MCTIIHMDLLQIWKMAYTVNMTCSELLEQDGEVLYDFGLHSVLDDIVDDTGNMNQLKFFEKFLKLGQILDRILLAVS